MEKNIKNDKNANENPGELNKEIKTDNIKKNNSKNISYSTAKLEKKTSSHEYFFSSSIYQPTQTQNNNSNNLNNNNASINSNNSNHVNNNNQYQNILNNNQYPINNFNQNIYSNNMRNQSLFPRPSLYNNLNYNNYNLSNQYFPNQQNFQNMQKLFYSPNFFNNFNNNTMNIQNFQNNNQRKNDRRRHTSVFNPKQFRLNLDENKINQNPAKDFNNNNKIIGNNNGPNKINQKNDKIQEEINAKDTNSSKTESENSDNSNEENSSSSKANDFFKNIEETIEVMKKDNKNKDKKNNDQQKNNNKEKKASTNENTASIKTNNESKNINKNEDNEINSDINEELEEKELDYNNDMIKCLDGEVGTDSDCESMQIYDELPRDIHNHPFNKEPLSNERCIMCLCEKSCEEGYKCKECPMILCQDCSSMIVINYYGNKKHEHPLSISNKDSFKCNNCKKKIFNKKHFYFYCNKCNFYMCLKCYYPERKGEDEEELDDDDNGDSDEDEPMHNHPLKNISKSRQFICKLCGNDIDIGYKCINCDLNLCQGCANFIYSHKKRKNLHEHSLYLTVETDWKCEKCKKNFKEKICFNCIKCSLYYCVICFFE